MNHPQNGPIIKHSIILTIIIPTGIKVEKLIWNVRETVICQ